MTAMSNYLENAIAKHLFENTNYSRPANIYVALFTAAPSDSGGGTEVSGGTYARVAVQTGASTGWTISADQASNTADIVFPTATADWGTITHVGLFDASTSGNLLFWGALTANKTVSNGDVFKFTAGNLSVSIDN